MATLQGALLTTPILLPTLDPADRQCPICHEPYIAPSASTSTLLTDADKEWPVSVNMAVQPFGLKRCCGHILGRQCLEKHLQAQGAWRNKCPVCRDVWFGHGEDTLGEENALQGEEEEDSLSNEGAEQVRGTRRRSARIAARNAAGRSEMGGRMVSRHGVNRAEGVRRSRMGAEIRFMQRLLATLGVAGGSDEVKATLEDVEERLGWFYDELEE